MPAILFGSISTVADTSEMQRQAFNQAFEMHGLDWRWDRDEYRVMLEKSSGAKRIADYANSVGQTVDAKAIHQTKSDVYQKTLATSELSPRPGVVETIQSAKHSGLQLALVTTTSPENVSALLEALAPDVQTSDFAVIIDASDVEQPKPDDAAYALALRRLDQEPGDCVAIEDNLDGVRAAVAAGLRCVAFPNANTAHHDFAVAQEQVERLEYDDLVRLASDKSTD